MQAHQHGAGRRTGGHALRRRPAVRHRGQAGPQRRHFARGDRPAAGLQRRRHARSRSAQVADIKLVDGQTMIARENGRRRLTVRCDISRPRPGRLRRRGPAALRQGDRRARGLSRRNGWACSRTSHARRVHFLVLIPVTIGLIFVHAAGSRSVPRGRPDRRAAGRAVRLRRRRARPLRPRHAPEHVQRASASPPCSAWPSWTACSWSAGSSTPAECRHGHRRRRSSKAPWNGCGRSS